MKHSMEQDQQIRRELGRYKLASPSPDLHDRVMQSSREAFLAKEELRWADRWLRTRGALRQNILAFASAVMLILGLVMQLGAGQSVLADSLERLKVMLTVSGRLYRATSMDCTVLKSRAGDENSHYRVRWSSGGSTRIDMISTDGTEQTLWISKGIVSVADHAGGPVRSMAITAIPSKWQPLIEFLTPAILAQHMEQLGLTRAEHEDATQHEFLLVGKENRQVIEIAIDSRTYLPTTLRKYVEDSARSSRGRDCLEEVQFQWTKPVPQEPLVPGSSGAKRQVN